MRNKIFSLLSIMVLGIVLSACATKGQSQPPNTRTLNVTGNSQVMLNPDVAYISIGVQTQNANSDEAVSANNAQAQKVQDVLKSLSVDEKDIRTTNFSIYPQQQYDPNGQPTGISFVVDNTVYVTLRDLAKVGQVLGAVVNSGANNIYGIQYDVLDKTAALTEARKNAIANARTQAEDIAAAAGLQLGEIQSINFYNNYPALVVMMDNKAAGVGGGGSAPVTPGQLTVSVDVNIIYEIK